MQTVKIIKSLTFFVFLLLGIALTPAHAADSALSNLKQTGQAFATIAKEVSPAVVNIQSDQGEADQEMPEDMPPQFWEFFRMDPFSMPNQRPAMVRQGSGFIISQDGYIVTNNHLVQNASKITVKLLNNDEYTAKVIGTDPQSDIAVIKIDAHNLPVAQMGNSDQTEVGEWVVALGNPFGLSHSLSAGILSAKGRSSLGVSDYENFLQTDAAINPGNSGGPLLDLQGKVIGINTAIFSRSGGYMGIGFAIPINMAKNIIDQLIKKGSVTRGYLGVKIQPLTSDLANSFGITENKGILVAQVEPGTPADKAGVKQGDVIVSFDGQAVLNVGDFRNNVAAHAPGSSHRLTVIRDKKPVTLQIAVGNLNSATASKEDKDEPQLINKLGISVQALTEEIAGKLGVKHGTGVVVSSVKPGSLGEVAGLSRGALILEVNRAKVNSVNAFKNEITKAVKGNRVLLLVQDQIGTRYIVLKVG